MKFFIILFLAVIPFVATPAAKAEIAVGVTATSFPDVADKNSVTAGVEVGYSEPMYDGVRWSGEFRYYPVVNLRDSNNLGIGDREETSLYDASLLRVESCADYFCFGISPLAASAVWDSGHYFPYYSPGASIRLQNTRNPDGSGVFGLVEVKGMYNRELEEWDNIPRTVLSVGFYL